MSNEEGMSELSNSLFVFARYHWGGKCPRALARLLLEKLARCADNLNNTATTLSAFGYRATLVAFLCASFMEI